jgi:hypothetical protein
VDADDLYANANARVNDLTLSYRLFLSLASDGSVFARLTCNESETGGEKLVNLCARVCGRYGSVTKLVLQQFMILLSECVYS